MNKNNLNTVFGTLSETINGLITLGYTHDFNIQDECIICQKINAILSPDEFQIDQVFRFEGDSDPEYQSILYAISSDKYGIKGTLVDGYGTSSDEISSKLVEKLRTHANGNSIDIENKPNDATPQRPEGERTLNAPLVEMNLLEFIEQIKSESTWADSDRNSITIFKSDVMRIVLIGLHEHAELKPHKANGKMSVQVLEGKIEFTTEHQSTEIEKGQMIALHENLMHSVKALTESFFLLTLIIEQQQVLPASESTCFTRI